MTQPLAGHSGLPDDPRAVWPPPDIARMNKQLDLWGAWYEGDPQRLSYLYAETFGMVAANVDAIPPAIRTTINSGTLVGLAPRYFWGQPPSPGNLRSPKLHVPLAADIASMSSDLLFSEPPAFAVPDAEDKDSPTQRRLDKLMEESGFHAVLLEAGEMCAAYGGVYLRLGWDQQVADTVLLDAIPPDAAVPEFRSNRLTAVTFWKQLEPPADSNKTWRHLERHEPGRIYHALYVTGDSTKLGAQQPLASHPETAQFAALVNGQGFVETGAQGLAAEYVPNMRPNRKFRGSPFGRSDFSGIEPVMDGVDESYSSWMRDVRLAKGRLLVPDVYLQANGRGKGAVFDADQEIFQAVNAMPSNQGMQMQIVQFAIRYQEHLATCTELASRALRGAGYSVQTFGDSADVAVTATEVAARERRTYTTRSRKIEYWRPVLGRLMEVALQIDVAQFKPDGVTAVRPDIEWPDGVSIDPQTLATTLSLLETAKAASTRTKVELLNPDWDATKVAEEVRLIQQEGMPPAVPPPGDGTPDGDTGTPAARTPAQPPPGDQPTEPVPPRGPAPPRGPRPARPGGQ